MHLSGSVAVFCRLPILLVIAFLNYGHSNAQADVNGQKLFALHCEACHSFNEDGIGPQLGGLKGVVDQKYLTAFINSPKAMIDANYSRAVDKYKKFGTLMPDFNHLKPAEIQDLIAYILQQPAPKTDGLPQKAGLENPVVAPIQPAAITLNLQKVMQFPATTTVKQPRTRINKMGVHPVTKEKLVADSQGKIYILNASNQPAIFFDVKPHFSQFTNVPGLATGLGSFAFHPEFAKNGLFYTTHTEPNKPKQADFAYADSIPVKLQWIINEWVLNPRGRTVTGKPRELLRVNVTGQTHGMQEIAFNPYAKPTDEDYGLLYVGIGDGGSVEMGYSFIARDSNLAWGKVLRINPTERTSKNGQYGIPATNPYVGRNGLDEVYARGFRNPNRISWTQDGKVLVTNIGQRNIESLYLLKPGKNYGWPDREGTFLIDSTTTVNTVFPLPDNDAQFGYSYPVAQFDHDEGNAIMGGFDYTGNELPQLRGKYIFGEIVRGRVFYVNLADIREGQQAPIYEFPITLAGKPTTLKELSQAGKVDFRIGQDAAGELYLFTRADGMMYKIVK